MTSRDLLLRAWHKVLRNRLTRAWIRSGCVVTPRSDLERFGTEYGGWWLPTTLIDPDSIVYSVGIGGDASFDLAIMHRFGCRVWGFDPTPFSIEWVAEQQWPPGWTFDPTGVWVDEGEMVFAPPAGRAGGSSSITRPGNQAQAFTAKVATLEQLMARHGHARVDVLKMDIEGAEGPVLDRMVATGLRPRVLLVEFDQPEWPWQLVRRVRRLVRAGYVLVNVETWNFVFVRIGL
jgi:FkbM family methyltransferase